MLSGWCLRLMCCTCVLTICDCFRGNILKNDLQFDPWDVIYHSRHHNCPIQMFDSVGVFNGIFLNDIGEIYDCGRVTQYGDGSMLWKTLYFSLWNNSFKFKMLWFFESRHHYLLESIAKIAHFYILTFPGGHFDEKIKKTITFSKVVGRKLSLLD